MEKLTCAFTGHRVMFDDFDEQVLEDCIKNVIEQGADTFYCGMAVGFDLVAASIVLRLKSTYPHIKLIACVPCEGQERYYSPENKVVYKEVLSSCEEVRVLAKKYYRGCMHVRDNYMVDHSDVLIAYMHEASGGTHYTLTYAEKKGKLIYIM